MKTTQLTSFFFTIIIIISCKQQHNTFSSKRISIKFKTDSIKYLNQTSFIKIDNKLIKHSFDNQDIRYLNALPASKVNMFNNNSGLYFKTTPELLIIKLKKILHKQDNYQFDSIEYIDTNYTLYFYRKDKKRIKISHPNDYPIILNQY